MQIIAQCPRCSSSCLLDADATDRRIRCQRCHRLFKVPKTEEMFRAYNLVKQVSGSLYVDENGKMYG